MPLEVQKGIYWVGVVDWNIRSFHGHTYTTKRGTTYNAYLIIDDKITLVDTVMASFSDEFIARIKEIIDPGKIDYIIANHVETDHSGALPAIMKLAPKAKIFGTAKCKEGLFRHYYGKWDFQTVKTNDTLKLGKRSLSFIEAPMIHWPDSMFTYCPEHELLMPNDAFGQHLATSGRFDDEVDKWIIMDEATKYYGNILWPLGSVILKKIEEVQRMNIPLKMFAPSHGIIWRKDPKKIINSYVDWAKNKVDNRVVIVFETMWKATERMARKITQGIIDSGVPVSLYDVTASDRSEVIKDMLQAKGFLFGSSTHDNGMLPTLAGFLEFIKGLMPRNRISAAFGSYGWAGGATKEIENILKATDIEVAQPSLGIQFVPDGGGFEKCYEFGKDFASRVKEETI